MAPGLGIAQPSSHAESLAPLQIRAGEVAIGGKLHALPHEPRFRMVDFVRQELPRLPNLPAVPAAYDVAIADDVRGSELLSVLQSAAFGGRRAAFVVPAGVVLHLRVPTPAPTPTPSAEDAWAQWPQEVLWVDVGATELDLWRVPFDAKEAQANPGRKVATTPSALAPALSAECAKVRCSPFVVTMAPEASASSLLTMLHALSALPEHRGAQPPPHALLLLNREHPPTVQTLRLGSTSVSGRLPPPEIQKVVRAEFGKLRACYTEGLGRDAALTGRVMVRFVIDREGKVSRVIAAPESTLSDEKVVDCVLAHFSNMVFPKPEGGIVSVVYPIVFASE